jgi:hypothetical protein
LAFALAAGCGSGPGTGSNGDAGVVDVDGSVIAVTGSGSCPGISSFSVDPAELAIGQPAQVAIETVGSTPTGIQWTASPASLGMFSSPTSASGTFVCKSAGNVTLSVQVMLDEPPKGNVCEGVAYTTYHATVVCE